MKKGLLLIFTMFLGQLSAQSSFYSFTVTDIDNNQYEFIELKSKKVMIVNVASKCGYTKQYKQLQSIYEEYGGDDFVIIAFPANNFLWQEPGSNQDIKQFCSTNYQITFPMMAKISVKGNDKHPIYRWLTQKSENGVMSSKVKWNFQKYLVNENGQLEHVYAPSVLPDDPRIIEGIVK